MTLPADAMNAGDGAEPTATEASTLQADARDRPAHRPLARGPMVPQPWAGHPVGRFLRRVFRRDRSEPEDLPAPQPVLLRRLGLLVLVLCCAMVGTDYMAEVLPNHGNSWVEQGVLVLFALLFAWISAGFWTAVMGAVVMLAQPHRWAERAAALAGRPRDPTCRTAIIMPICNEDVATVFAGLRSTWESLEASGRRDGFDFFVLSDTGKPDVRVAEQAAVSRFIAVLGGDNAKVRLYYRWRQHRTRKKAGNVADFCRRYGRDYRYMIVLDADSVMTGTCLNALVDLMEDSPDAGLIQSAPRATGLMTAHARALQFSSALYGPVFTAGMYHWQLGESHYWGHNAIMRVAPFMEHCALAPIPGRGSMSGDVMSHDFVEASLLRRAGWRVWVAYDLPGSYEQVPPSLVTEVQRDRRWCHGNLQNSRLMFEPGLHPVHRSMFLTGVLAYASAPLWLAFLLLSSLLFAQHAADVPEFFKTPYQIFPLWPTDNLRLMLGLFGMTAFLLIAPKLLSLGVVMIQGRARDYGGVVRMWVSAVLEFAYTVFLAPVRMLFHSQFVIGAMLGWRNAWVSPPRDDDATSWREAWQRHGTHTLFGVAWVAALLLFGAGKFPWWLSPVIAGILLAVPLSVWSSRSTVGRSLRGQQLLMIPEERHEPPVLIRTRELLGQAPDAPGFQDLLHDAGLRREVRCGGADHAPSRAAKGEALGRLIDAAVTGGAQALTPAQQMRLIGDPDALDALAARVAAAEGHADWQAGESMPATGVPEGAARAEPPRLTHGPASVSVPAG